MSAFLLSFPSRQRRFAIQDVEITKDGQHMVLRTSATGVIGPLSKAAWAALPDNVRDTANT